MGHLYFPLPHLLSIAIFFLTLIFSASLVQSRMAPSRTLAWLLAIVLIPYVGIPLYLMLGGRKIRRGAANKKKIYFQTVQTKGALSVVEKLLLNTGMPSKTSDNQVKLMSDGVRVFEKMIELIEGAKFSIYIETFILDGKEVGEILLEKLSKKASEGVQVYLLMDALGSFWANRKALRKLKDSGGKIASFMPLLHIPFRSKTNLRDHRKIIIIDQKQAIVGGMNLANEYMGPLPDERRWKDFALLISGSAIHDLNVVFNSDWEFATESKIPESLVQNHFSGNSEIQIVACGPDVPEDVLYDAILTAIYDAKEKIWIATPYFIPDESIARALELACRRGVDVRILVPAKSNHALADLGRGSYIRQIEAAGAKIFRHPKMVHAKATIIDQSFAIVGSANMDMRSLFLNYEIAVFIYSEFNVKEMENWFGEIQTQASPGYTKIHFGIRTLEGIGRILSPML